MLCDIRINPSVFVSTRCMFVLAHIFCLWFVYIVVVWCSLFLLVISRFCLSVLVFTRFISFLLCHIVLILLMLSVVKLSLLVVNIWLFLVICGCLGICSLLAFLCVLFEVCSIYQSRYLVLTHACIVTGVLFCYCITISFKVCFVSFLLILIIVIRHLIFVPAILPIVYGKILYCFCMFYFVPTLDVFVCGTAICCYYLV